MRVFHHLPQNSQKISTPYFQLHPQSQRNCLYFLNFGGISTLSQNPFISTVVGTLHSRVQLNKIQSNFTCFLHIYSRLLWTHLKDSILFCHTCLFFEVTPCTENFSIKVTTRLSLLTKCLSHYLWLYYRNTQKLKKRKKVPRQTAHQLKIPSELSIQSSNS